MLPDCTFFSDWHCNRRHVICRHPSFQLELDNQGGHAVLFGLNVRIIQHPRTREPLTSFTTLFGEASGIVSTVGSKSESAMSALAGAFFLFRLAIGGAVVGLG